MYEVLEISLGDLTRLYQYKLKEIFGADLTLKGFDYPWLLTSRTWAEGEHVLDIGASYSQLPMHIQETYGCEVWVADDFGMNSNDSFWQRKKSPSEHIGSHPHVRFILERVGDPVHSNLPTGYFNVIYSLSTLEHVPAPMVPAVWRHMDSLLKPDGEMLHAIDIPFPSNQGWKKVIGGMLYDLLYPLFSPAHHLRHYKATPQALVRLIFQTLGIRHASPQGLSVLKTVLDPDMLSEGYAIGLNRIQKDGMTDYRYQRTATLLLHLHKLAGDGSAR